MANPYRDRPLNRKVELLADLMHDATNDLNDWLYSKDGHAMDPYIRTADKLVVWAEELRAEVRRWSQSGKAEAE